MNSKSTKWGQKDSSWHQLGFPSQKLFLLSSNNFYFFTATIRFPIVVATTIAQTKPSAPKNDGV